MATLPAATDFTGASITEAQFKTAITDLRTFLADQLGTAGTVAVALNTLGALCNDYVDKSVNYTVIASDRGKLIGCTGTVELALTAAATLGDGFSFAVRCISGTLTLNPNSSELIDGAATMTVDAGRSCVVVCTGTAWQTVGYAPVVTVPVEISDYTSGKSTLVSNGDSNSTTATSYTGIISRRFPKAGTVTASLKLVSTGGAGHTAYARIYKNGVAFGTARSTTSTSGSIWDEVLAFAAGDTIQVYAYTTSGDTATAYLNVWTGLTTNFAMLSGDTVGEF